MRKIILKIVKIAVFILAATSASVNATITDVSIVPGELKVSGTFFL